MCKVFPSTLGPAAMRWFNGLKADSVDSYRQLTQAFGSCFVTNSRALQPLSALLSLSMRDGETLKTYSGRYWEMYNEMNAVWLKECRFHLSKDDDDENVRTIIGQEHRNLR